MRKERGGCEKALRQAEALGEDGEATWAAVSQELAMVEGSEEAMEAAIMAAMATASYGTQFCCE